jgi:hypothetical protein
VCLLLPFISAILVSYLVNTLLSRFILGGTIKPLRGALTPFLLLVQLLIQMYFDVAVKAVDAIDSRIAWIVCTFYPIAVGQIKKA